MNTSMELTTKPESGFLYSLKKSEELVVSLALGIMVFLPVLGILLRFFKTGIEGSDLFVTHLTLLVGILGSALAAREGRLLSLSTAEALLHGWGKTLVRVISCGVGAAIAFSLMGAGFLFVSSTPPDLVLALGIPLWCVQIFLPVGFAVIMLRIILGVSESWKMRGLTTLVSLLLLLVFFYAWIDPQNPPSWLPFLRERVDAGHDLTAWFPYEPADLFLPGIILLVIATLMGLPIFAMLGGAALLFFFAEDGELAASVSIDHYEVVSNATFPTIPLFTLAGYFLADSGASQRLIRLFHALFGSLRGGPAIVTVAVCAFFTSFTGASGVTILAVAALLWPVLKSAGYNDRQNLGFLTCSGSLGMLFPPCLPVILYAIIANQEIEMMFLAGLIPGLLLVTMTGSYGVWLARFGSRTRQAFRLKEALLAIRHCFWELMIPVVALLGIFGGWATPVEAAAVTALYTFLVETCIYRDLHITREVPRSMAKCGLLVGGVLLILGVAMGFTNYLIYAEVPSNIVDWVKSSIESPFVFLLCLNLLLILVGCLMDVFSAVIVMVPLIVPLGIAFGIDPLHLGIIFLANLELGFITPPIGMNLFLASYRFGKPMIEVCRSVLPFLGIRIVAVMLITYLPFLTTWLPRLLSPNN